MSTRPVICSYQPKEGKDAELEVLIREHVPAMRALGLITDRPHIVMKSTEEGCYVEVFEWISAEKAKEAPTHAEVARIWDAMAAVSDFVPLSSVTQCQTPFAHFDARDDLAG